FVGARPAGWSRRDACAQGCQRARPRGQLMQTRPAILSIDRLVPRFQGCGRERRSRATDRPRVMRALPQPTYELIGDFPPLSKPDTKRSYHMKDDIVIVSAARTPVGAFNGAFAALPAHELGKVAIEETLKRAGVEGAQVSEVILGQILTAGQGQTPARQASIAAGIPVESPAWGVNQLCGSGLRAVALGYQAIVNGDS